MIRRLLRYLFPRPRLRDRLPLLPLEWSMDTPVKPHRRQAIELIKGFDLARTDADAKRLLVRYRGQPINTIIQAERRIRRREPRIKRGWRRLKRLW